MTNEELEQERKRKKQSTKRKLVIYWNIILIPIFLVTQLGLAYFQSSVELPLNLIISGTIGLNGAYFGVNYLQKKLYNGK